MTPVGGEQEITDVFRGSWARAAGLVTEHQLRGPKFRRLFQDVYVPARVPVTHELRCRGAALIVPSGAVLTGRSAATVYGVDLAATHDPVEIIVPERSRFGPVQGMHIRRTAPGSREAVAWKGIRIATPLRTAVDLLLRHSPRRYGWVRRLRTAVADLDAYLRAGLVHRPALWKLLRRRHRGIVLARHALELADPAAESPPESDLRVLLRSAGLEFVPQVEVREKRRFLARVDLARPGEQVGVEYDGRWHDTTEQARRDRQRRKRLTRAGWRIVVVRAEELSATPWKVVERVRAVLTQVVRPAR